MSIVMMHSILLALSAASVLAVDPPYGQLSVKGTHLVGSNGQTVALHGMSLFWSQWKPEFWNEETVKAIKCKWNSNVVRAAMGVDQDGYVAHNHTQVALVNSVVQAAINQGIYVLIDWHITGDTTPYQANALAFFSEMAENWGGSPNIIYEIWNEPNGVNWDTVKAYANKVIPVIRALDPDNVIIVGTPTWSQDVDVASADPLTGYSNVMYTLHFYAATHSVSKYGAKAQTALNNGLPIFVTEYGTSEASANGTVDEASTKEWWSFLDKNNISYINWAMDDKSESASALKAGTTSSQVGDDDVTTTSGALVKNHLLGQDNGVSCSTKINVLAAFAVASLSAVAPPYGQLSVKGTQLIGQDGKPVELHGMSLFWSQWMEKYWNEATVKALKCSFNSNVVRASMGADQGGYTVNQTAQEKLLDTVVQACIDQGIYVLIDWHITGDSTPYTSQAVDFFTRKAKQYSKYPNVIYEIWNEPNNVNWDQIKTYANKVIPAIRAADKKNVIIVGTPTYSQDVDIAAASPLTGYSNIMYTLHIYAATHTFSTYSARAQTALDKGLPIFVTEYGTSEASGSGVLDKTNTTKWWDFWDQHKMSYINWVVGDKAETSDIAIPGTTPEQIGQDAQLTDSGKFVKEHMLKQKNSVSC